MTHKQKNLKDLFLGYQTEMKAKLATARDFIDHPGTKGTFVENNWIKWLNTYLPNRYKVDTAFVIDCDGKISDQIDVVIYDCQYSPFAFNQDGIKYIPAESVYAVFEVKQNLTKDHIIYAAEKAESVRALKRTSVQIVHAGGVFNKPKEPFKILAGILTSESSWNPALGEAFENAIKDLTPIQSLELGCALHGGSFIIKNDNGQLLFSRSTENEALLFFFLNLFMELQKLGTVPAMDIVQYAKVLDSI